VEVNFFKNNFALSSLNRQSGIVLLLMIAKKPCTQIKTVLCTAFNFNLQGVLDGINKHSNSIRYGYKNTSVTSYTQSQKMVKLQGAAPLNQ
jgi:hypothetical protein